MENLSQELELNQEEDFANKDILAQNIAFFRKKMNMSQTDLAKHLQYSNKNISKWEQGETTPDVFTVKKLAHIFGVSVDTLLSPIASESKEAIKTKSAVPFRYKLYILLLVESIIFLLTCTAFFILKAVDVKNFNSALLFLYVSPIMTLTVFIFECCIKKKVELISLSLFGWLLILCFFITFVYINNIEYLFLVGFAYQFLAIAMTQLINSGKIIKINKILIKRTKK